MDKVKEFITRIKSEKLRDSDLEEIRELLIQEFVSSRPPRLQKADVDYADIVVALLTYIKKESDYPECPYCDGRGYVD